ncbi:MAG: sugar phosphate isomerase/epimerase family protein [Anaerolineales bacterium]
MIKLACHAWAYNDKSLDEALGTIARLGFRHVDLGSGPHFNPEAAAKQPNAEAKRIRDLLEQHHLELTDVYLMLPYTNAPEPERRDMQLALFGRLVPFVLALGAPGITISPGIVHPDGDDHALARAIPALMRMSEIVEDVDVRLSYEPHMDSPIITPETALLALEAVPGLSLSLDYAHFIVQGYSLGDLTPLLPHTSHVQIRQAVKGRLQTPFDQGRVDLGLLMRDLQAADYRGVVSVEYMTTVGWHGMMPVNITQETVKTRDALRQVRQALQTN